MRTIKFRGKSKATGEWLYGFYQEHEDGRVAITPALNGEFQEASDYEVIPETVGQFTGLKDRKGIEIYEGDILQVMGVGGYCRRQVEFNDGAFHTDYHSGSSTKETPVLIQKRAIVLGNTSDNPDLLKQKE